MVRNKQVAGRRTEAAESKTEVTGSKCKTEATESKTEATESKTEATGGKTGATKSKTEAARTGATESNTGATDSVSKIFARKIGVRPGAQTIEIIAVKTRTAMLITRTGDSFRNGGNIAPALLKRCDRFLMHRIRFCRNPAVSARSHSHHVNYGMHTLTQSMEATSGTATLSCASPRFTHTSFVDKSGDWQSGASMSS